MNNINNNNIKENIMDIEPKIILKEEKEYNNENETQNFKKKKNDENEIKMPCQILKEPPKIPEKPKDFTNSLWFFNSKQLYKNSKLIYNESFTLPNTPKDQICWNGNDPNQYDCLLNCFYYSLKRIYIMEKIQLPYNEWFQLIVECLEEQ
jgi:hypothetical protein